MKIRTVLKIISLLLVGFIIGWCANERHTIQLDFKLEEVDSIDNNIDSINNEINSLLIKIDSIELEKSKSIDSLEIILREKNLDKIKIKKLSIDSSIILLRQNIKEYEN